MIDLKLYLKPKDSWAKLTPGWRDAEDLRTLHAGGADWEDAGGGYPDGVFAFAEHDGRVNLVGLSLRTIDGCRGAPSRTATGCKRGLVFPNDLHQMSGPILVVKGASDVPARTLKSVAKCHIDPCSTYGGFCPSA